MNYCPKNVTPALRRLYMKSTSQKLVNSIHPYSHHDTIPCVRKIPHAYISNHVEIDDAHCFFRDQSAFERP